MFQSQVLETVLGLVFFYLLLSLGFTALNEIMSALISARSKNIRNWVNNLLDDENTVVKLFDHPLMKSLSSNGKPSYIPSKTFALSLISTLTNTVDSYEEIRNRLKEKKDSSVAQQLLPLIESAQGNMDTALRNVEEWFDTAMNRVSGWYKRWTMYVTAIGAFIICLLFNADTIMMAKVLWSDSALRSRIANEAEHYSQNNQTGSSTTASVDSAAIVVSTVIQEVQASNFPLGWIGKNDPSNKYRSKMLLNLQTFPPVKEINTPAWWLLKLIGILFTVLAVTLGAPFWFDFLNKIVKIRSSGTRVGSSGEKDS